MALVDAMGWASASAAAAASAAVLAATADRAIGVAHS